MLRICSIQARSSPRSCRPLKHPSSSHGCFEEARFQAQGILKKPATSRDLALVPYQAAQEEPEDEEAEQDDLQEEDEEEVQEQPQEEEEEEGDEVEDEKKDAKPRKDAKPAKARRLSKASPSGPQPLPQGGQGPFGGRLRPLLQQAQREAEAVLVEEV